MKKTKIIMPQSHQDFPGGSPGEESICSAGDLGSILGFDPWVGKIPWRMKRLLTLIFCARSNYGRSRSDEVMKKIQGRQGHLGPHPWRGHKEKTWQARPSRIRDPPGWPRPLPHPVSSPLFCCSCLPCWGFLCCLPRALLLLFHWIN